MMDDQPDLEIAVRHALQAAGVPSRLAAQALQSGSNPQEVLVSLLVMASPDGQSPLAAADRALSRVGIAAADRVASITYGLMCYWQASGPAPTAEQLTEFALSAVIRELRRAGNQATDRT